MRSAPIAVLLGVAALFSGCTPEPFPAATTLPVPQDSPQPIQYSDDQVKGFLERFPALATFEGSKLEGVLDLLAIEVSQLPVLDTYIGDCLSVTVYDLSPSFSLVLDENACFGRRIKIVPK